MPDLSGLVVTCCDDFRMISAHEYCGPATQEQMSSPVQRSYRSAEPSSRESSVGRCHQMGREPSIAKRTLEREFMPSLENTHKNLACIRGECRGRHAQTPSSAVPPNAGGISCSLSRVTLSLSLSLPSFLRMCLLLLLHAQEGPAHVSLSLSLSRSLSLSLSPLIMHALCLQAARAPLGERALLSKVMRQRPDSTWSKLICEDHAANCPTPGSLVLNSTRV